MSRRVKFMAVIIVLMLLGGGFMIFKNGRKKDRPTAVHGELLSVSYYCGGRILADFDELMDSYLDEPDDVYVLDDDDDPIRTGRDIVNSEEEISVLIRGCWRYETDDDPVDLDIYFPDEMMLYGYDGQGSQASLKQTEIVNEPLGDIDSSWHLIASDEAGKIYRITVADGVLYLEHEGQTIAMERVQ